MLVGFKGKYFTLQAIQACSSGVIQHANISTYKNYALLQSVEEEVCDASPPDEVSVTAVSKEPDQRPCHCNLFFTLLARTSLLFAALFHAPYCRCRKTKTGVAPPHYFLSHTNYIYTKENNEKNYSNNTFYCGSFC